MRVLIFFTTLAYCTGLRSSSHIMNGCSKVRRIHLVYVKCARRTQRKSTQPTQVLAKQWPQQKRDSI